MFYHCAVFYFVTLAKSRINVSAEVFIKSMGSSGQRHLRWNPSDTKTCRVQCWCNLFIRCLTDGANPPGPPIHIPLCSLHRTVNLAHGNLRQSCMSELICSPLTRNVVRVVYLKLWQSGALTPNLNRLPEQAGCWASEPHSWVRAYYCLTLISRGHRYSYSAGPERRGVRIGSIFCTYEVLCHLH